MSDAALRYRIESAQDDLFSWMHTYVGYDLKSGERALKELAGYDAADAWVNWYNEGEV